MTIEIAIVVAIIILAFSFTFTNGFQDGSSVTACAIASRALTPIQAVVLVSFFELLGAIFGGTAVTHTIEGITNWPATPDLLPVIMSSLVAAISWNLITRRFGIPSSSTHALVGGMLGSLWAAGGSSHIVWGNFGNFAQPNGIWKVVLTLIVSPLAGFIAGYLVLLFSTLMLARATMKVNKSLKHLQCFSTSVLAFAHGANDPQKSVGVILLTLHAVGMHASNDNSVPLYLRIASGVAIAMGVAALAPSIVKRVGTGIYRLRNLHALSAETASASVVLFGSLTGGPVSASQVISCSVMGVGSAIRIKGVHWAVAQELLAAWFLTIPCSAILSCGLYMLAFKWLNVFLPHPGSNLF